MSPAVFASAKSRCPPLSGERRPTMWSIFVAWNATTGGATRRAATDSREATQLSGVLVSGFPCGRHHHHGPGAAAPREPAAARERARPPVHAVVGQGAIRAQPEG